MFFSSLNLLKVKPGEIDRAKSKISENSNQYWDPTGNLPIENIKENSAEVFARFEKLKENPDLIKKHYRNAILIGIGLAFLVVPFLFFVMASSADGDSFYAVALPFLPYVAVSAYYRSLSKDLLKIQVARLNNWLYDPKVNKNRHISLIRYFPEIFDKQGHSQEIDDQFWGLTKSNDVESKYYFYSALFKYTTGRGKHKTEHQKHFFTFGLNKSLNCRFHMLPENKVSSFFKSKKEIEVESIALNKMFKFSYNGSKAENALEIVKTLSPAVQEKIVELSKSKGPYEVLFANNTITFLFNGFLLKKMKTNLKESLELKKEDQDNIDIQIKNMIDVFEGMIKYLD